ncbi:MAG: ABC transporter permease [Bacteroidales bacterium]|nr:ABC transporter permease [Bacteroidales bacterium]
MNKTLLVIQREYATRVRKPSFWLLTILVPILFAALYAIPIYLALKPAEKSIVLVADESGLFGSADRNDTLRTDSRFASTNNIEYRYAATFEYAQRSMEADDDIKAILYVRRRASEAIPTDACLYYKSELPPQQVRYDVDRQLQRILRNRLLQAHNISDDEYALITNTRINLRTEDLETGREAFLEVKTGLGLVLSILIYFVIFMFGSQVMRGVVEEKSSRIVEVIVCSVRPFQLMMGKVIGIALVGLTQFLLWVALTGVALVGIQASNSELFHIASDKHNITELATKGSDATLQMQQNDQLADLPSVIEGIASIDFNTIVPLFLFYFIFGYLLYATLFAAAGAMSDTDTDTQIVSLPLTVPLLATLLCMPAMMNSPSGMLSQVLSIIPFTSPVAMMLRIPFGVSTAQVVISMLLLLVSIPLCTWLSARIYRSSILRYNLLTHWRKKNK